MLRQDRRKSPRLESDTVLRATVIAAGHEDVQVQVVKVLNVSFGGFLIESGVAFEPGETYEFRFDTGRRRSAHFKARAIYRVERPAMSDDARHACGFAFLDAEDPFTLWRIRELIAQVTAALDIDHLPDQPLADPTIA
jgi:hypothetical protein